MKKIIIFILLSILLATILSVMFVASTSWVSFLIMQDVIDPPIDKEKMESIFKKDYEVLVIVTNYLANSSYESVYIRNFRGSGIMDVGGDRAEIEDIKVIEAINALENRGYSSIEKNNNTISFLRHTSFKNGRGIAYSIDGNEPVLPYLRRLEPLSKPNWYYYNVK